ncbi:murein hydrolase activator EnvC family protein [Effusibacillus pohliae]|uniref:murein hydrolase activator EnvC family protein n=1 Tax=Effusibacillus pohliae TaxID=232270 RepID=UPI0003615A5F|nr:peptidoglycan DD-metalloendopeptidase family protein [Effusibacillus pohliae]
MAAKKLMAGFIAGAILLTPLLTTAQASIESDQKRLDELRQQYDQRLKQIEQLRSKEQDLQKRLAAVNQQIVELNQQIDALQAEINAGAEKIRQMEIEIQKTQEKLEARKNLLKERLRVVYEEGDVSYLEVLFASTDFSDFIDRISTLSLVVNQDKRLVESIKREKQKLDDIQADLKREQAAREVRQNALLAAKAEQDKAKAEQQSLLAQVQQDRKMTEEQARKEAAEMQAIEAQLVAAIRAQQQATGGKQIVASGSGWLWPVPSSHVISSGYGPRWGSFHKGIDIPGPIGTPIVAVDNGIVRFAGTASGFGHWVVIEHANGVMSVYGHMYGNGILVSPGQEVKRGQQIALIGNDGESTGPHLHFGVATGISGSSMNYVNPMGYVSP